MTKSSKIKKPIDLREEILNEFEEDMGGLVKQPTIFISTQVPGIDYRVIGKDGIPSSRLTIIKADEGGGKTTLALQTTAECQKQDGIVIYSDLECKLDYDYAEALGVDMNKIIPFQAPYLEKFFETTEKAILIARKKRDIGNKKKPMLIVLDSMNAAISKEQFDAEYTDKHYGPQARAYSFCLPKIMPLIKKEQVTLLFITQIRKDIGVIYGNDEKICGGKAPLFYASLILELKNKGAEKDKDKNNTKIANKVKIKATKNQIEKPFRETQCLIRYGQGFDRFDSIVFEAERLGIIKKSGAWYSYKDKKIGQGYKQASEYLMEKHKTRENILKKIRKELVK